MRRGTVALLVFGLLVVLASASGGVSAAPATGSADVSVKKSDSPDPVVTGGTLTYSIQVQNAGPDAATNVVVTDRLPGGVTFVSATTSQGSCSTDAKKQRVTCRLGTVGVTVGPTYIPGGGPVYVPGNASITIEVRAPGKAGKITNTATVLSDQKDPVAHNNTATATTRVIEAPHPPKTKKPTCAGRQATIVGTPAANVLRGTAHRDVVVARGDTDFIVTYGGKDVVCAGGGNDLIKAGGQGDLVFGGRGKDKLLGMRGDDKLRGGPGRDLLKGGPGDDRLIGGPGSDRCIGGPGGDVFRFC